ncbi:type III secretion system (T3SS) inner membrane Yop/YscD-like protein [Actinomadura pelletieri DSM 43383]|uniref:Type III secretion system (T3SS) inner membrane Yop/YscD-like protein n=1 Tax=Actinomadura pelletieri DSM 43383 TaxID=1120940 RepID=A0A495QYF9_9ACTN|nr:FHA domain-containing protein [Actinomadura pelletieri]RKS79239.1 type III secretion system (T3SS) inner membrane Yop/YscD-like protein [Actinomadura pelletieri DSM 43383]
MSPFTLTLIKLAFLAVLWLFVIAAVGVIRADLFGSRAATRAAQRASQPGPSRSRQPRQPRQSRQPSEPRSAQQGAPTKLVVVQGERTGTVIDLTGVPITIGRANDATLVVTDDYASSRHARLYAQDGQWIVEDLGSTNGTYLGRTKVSRPMPVPPGVPVRIGKTVIELRK